MIAVEKFFAQILFYVYNFLDTIGNIFCVLAGTETIDYEGNQLSLLDIFIKAAVPTKIILTLILVGVGIAVICTSIRIGKNIVSDKARAGGSVVGRPIALLFASIGGMFLCMFCIGSFIGMSGTMLKAVNASLGGTQNLTFSQNLFSLSVNSSYMLDYSNPIPLKDETGQQIQATDENGKLIYETDEQGNVLYDDYGRPKPQYLYTYDYYAYTDDEVKANELNDKFNVDDFYNPEKKGDPYLFSGWAFKNKDGVRYTASDLNFATDSPDDVFGVRGKILFGVFESEDRDYIKPAKVELRSFNFLTAYLTAFVMFISIVFLSLGLVKRLYDICISIFCMPLILGWLPLDDGARFKAWLQTLISKILVAFAAVIAVNVFFIISSAVATIDFNAVFPQDTLVQTLLKMFIMLGGALCISSSPTLIARWIGTSADESREMAQSFRTIATGATVAGGAALGARNVLFGGYNKYGRPVKGVVPAAGQFARGGVRFGNAIGETIGGSGYAGSRAGSFARWLGGSKRETPDKSKAISLHDSLTGKHRRESAVEKMNSGAPGVLDQPKDAVGGSLSGGNRDGKFNETGKSVGTPDSPAPANLTSPHTLGDGSKNETNAVDEIAKSGGIDKGKKSGEFKSNNTRKGK